MDSSNYANAVGISFTVKFQFTLSPWGGASSINFHLNSMLIKRKIQRSKQQACRGVIDAIIIQRVAKFTRRWMSSFSSLRKLALEFLTPSEHDGNSTLHSYSLFFFHLLSGKNHEDSISSVLWLSLFFFFCIFIREL